MRSGILHYFSWLALIAVLALASAWLYFAYYWCTKTVGVPSQTVGVVRVPAREPTFKLHVAMVDQGVVHAARGHFACAGANHRTRDRIDQSGVVIKSKLATACGYRPTDWPCGECQHRARSAFHEGGREKQIDGDGRKHLILQHNIDPDTTPQPSSLADYLGIEQPYVEGCFFLIRDMSLPGPQAIKRFLKACHEDPSPKSLSQAGANRSDTCA